jgi:hypothetical protein
MQSFRIHPLRRHLRKGQLTEQYRSLFPLPVWRIETRRMVQRFLGLSGVGQRLLSRDIMAVFLNWGHKVIATPMHGLEHPLGVPTVSNRPTDGCNGTLQGIIAHKLLGP